jgi:hypothetical protein
MADREYRILITGSRAWDNPGLLAYELALAAGKSGVPRDEVVIVHGACPTGADAQAAGFAVMHGYRTEPHPADWQQGKSAGPRRNAELVALGADVCLAFLMPCAKPGCRQGLDGHASHGASHCADIAEKAGIPVRRFGPRGESAP